MLEVRDPAIKLFGKTIPLLSDEAEVNSIVSGEELSGDSNEDESSDSEPGRKEIVQETDKGAEDIKSAEIIQKVEPPTSEKPKSNLLNDVKLNDNEQDTEEDNIMESGEDVEKEKDDEKKNPEEKTMKKSDKILLCPRCNSMETKFCYYNNYNVNQPRHFCKSCQRYWTAGGTMRNVPVGAGRRRNKSSASRYCELSVSDALQAAAPINLPNGAYNQHYHHRHHHPLPVGSPNTHGTVLTFGSSTDSPLCQSMASMLNLTGEKKESAVVTKSDFRMGCRENGCDDNRPAASATATRTVAGSEEGGDEKIDSSNEHLSQNINGYANHQIPGGFPGFQWPYGFVPFPTGLVPSAGFPMPFYPPPSYWNGVAPVPWTTTTTVRPWVVSSSSCSTAPISPGSNPTSPTLGKHSREGETLNQERSSSVLVPKILRIDDPEEAAKSSIWTTLGIKKEKVDHVSKGGFFKGLQSKKKNDVEKTKDSSVLNANPAALARSITLQERA